MASAQNPRVFWICLEMSTGELSDPFRVRLQGPDGAVVEDVKEQLLTQHSTLFQQRHVSGTEGSLPPLPWVSLWLSPSATSAEGGGSGVIGGKLSPSKGIDCLPEGAGTASWPLVARVASQASGKGKGVDTSLLGGRPPTLFEQGLADEDEPEQIRNARDFSELYPGGKLPRSTMPGTSASKCRKVTLVFGGLFLFAFGITHLLSIGLPTLTGYPVAVPTPQPGLRKPNLEALWFGKKGNKAAGAEPRGVGGVESTGQPVAEENTASGTVQGRVQDGGKSESVLNPVASGSDRTEL